MTSLGDSRDNLFTISGYTIHPNMSNMFPIGKKIVREYCIIMNKMPCLKIGAK